MSARLKAKYLFDLTTLPCVHVVRLPFLAQVSSFHIMCCFETIQTSMYPLNCSTWNFNKKKSFFFCLTVFLISCMSCELASDDRIGLARTFGSGRNQEYSSRFSNLYSTHLLHRTIIDLAVSRILRVRFMSVSSASRILPIKSFAEYSRDQNWDALTSHFVYKISARLEAACIDAFNLFSWFLGDHGMPPPTLNTLCKTLGFAECSIIHRHEDVPIPRLRLLHLKLFSLYFRLLGRRNCQVLHVGWSSSWLFAANTIYSYI